MEVLIGIVAAVVLGAIGLSVGRSGGRKAGLEEGRREVEGRLGSLVEAVRRGKIPPDVTAGTPEAALQQALQDGWAPR